eukprot:TRINITY_DN19108_c0_g1_i3.p1 TRINITY_DN19108_c0_g1~~TRINITY_DN19108_c0_g1_i3.p1  ORF type:complete len:401 (+),score=84.63 TRINITY_DN19108_c0_g1_i3:46-1248(+)
MASFGSSSKSRALAHLLIATAGGRIAARQPRPRRRWPSCGRGADGSGNFVCVGPTMDCWQRGTACGSGQRCRAFASAGRKVAPASLFSLELDKCGDSAAALRVAASTALQLTPTDVQAFLDRLRALGRVPKAGSDMHKFVKKTRACLDASEDPSLARVLLVSFVDFSCREGALSSWPFVARHVPALTPEHLSDCLWALSRIPKPTQDVLEAVREVASSLTPRLSDLEDPSLLYRAIYGFARAAPDIGARAGDLQFRRAAERVTAVRFPALSPARLLRLAWSFARLGSGDARLYGTLATRLTPVVVEFSDRELEALKGLLARPEFASQSSLQRAAARELDMRREAQRSDKAPRKRAFRKAWTRASVLHTPASAESTAQVAKAATDAGTTVSKKVARLWRRR